MYVLEENVSLLCPAEGRQPGGSVARHVICYLLGWHSFGASKYFEQASPCNLWAKHRRSLGPLFAVLVRLYPQKSTVSVFDTA